MVRGEGSSTRPAAPSNLGWPGRHVVVRSRPGSAVSASKYADRQMFRTGSRSMLRAWLNAQKPQ